MKFAVSSDSTCDLKKEYRNQRDIWFAPLTFTMEKDGVMEEGLDDFSSNEEYLGFYQKVKSGYFPRTSKLNHEAHEAHFTKLAKAGVKEVLHFSISSGLADTVTVAQSAARRVCEQCPDFTVYTVDPLTATVGQGLLVEIAADCRDKGMTAKEAYDYVLSLRLRLHHCIIPEDLYYLKKGGRLSSVSAAVGTMLNIKPMLAFDSEGKLVVEEKCKGMKKAFSRVAERMQAAPVDENGKIVVVHTDNEQGANELASCIKKETGIHPVVTVMGPVIGAHVGPGSVSCCWLSKISR